MYIEHLSVFNFRNLEKVELTLSPRPVVLRGANGQGKTNLLEALYVSATGRSFRNAGPRELLRFEAERGWVKSHFERQQVRHLVEVQITPTRRSIKVDDRALRQTSRLLELVNVVAFFPDDLRIAKGSPEERRRFLDRAIANYRPEFVDAAIAYAHALKSRNALLRADPQPSREMIEVFDEQLIQHGSIVHQCRLEGLELLAPVAQDRFASIMSDVTGFGLALKSGVPRDEEAPFRDSFRRELAASYPRDRARGMTNVGPHRADLLMSVGGKDARMFASQGQQRAMILSLKLAEVSCLAVRLDSPPILLLDDVSSELDAERTRLLFEALAQEPSQLWVSTTGAAHLPLPEDAQLFDVEAGMVRRVD